MEKLPNKKNATIPTKDSIHIIYKRTNANSFFFKEQVQILLMNKRKKNYAFEKS